jgi:adenine-specific DNA-methyltransferase
VFLAAAASRLRALGSPKSEVAARLYGIDIDIAAARAAVDRVALELDGNAPVIIRADFFHSIAESIDEFTEGSATLRRQKFDAVVGNPPFIRYHNFDGPVRDAAAELMRQHGLNPSRLTNAWVPVVLGAAIMVRPGGRLAMVLPA